MLVEVGGDEGVVEGLDGGENQRGGGGDGGQNLVADGDSADEGLGVVSDDITIDPGGRGGLGVWTGASQLFRDSAWRDLFPA